MTMTRTGHAEPPLNVFVVTGEVCHPSRGVVAPHERLQLRPDLRRRFEAALPHGKLVIDGKPGIQADHLTHMVISDWLTMCASHPSMGRRLGGPGPLPGRMPPVRCTEVAGVGGVGSQRVPVLVSYRWLEDSIGARTALPATPAYYPPREPVPHSADNMTTDDDDHGNGGGYESDSQFLAERQAKRARPSDGRPAADHAAAACGTAGVDMYPVLLAELESLADSARTFDPKHGQFRQQAYVRAIHGLKAYRKRWLSSAGADEGAASGRVLTARMLLAALDEEGCGAGVGGDAALCAAIKGKTREKCRELLRTGQTRRMAQINADPLLVAKQALSRCWGIGQAIAERLYTGFGLTTIPELQAVVTPAMRDTGIKHSVGYWGKGMRRSAQPPSPSSSAAASPIQGSRMVDDQEEESGHGSAAAGAVRHCLHCNAPSQCLCAFAVGAGNADGWCHRASGCEAGRACACGWVSGGDCCPAKLLTKQAMVGLKYFDDLDKRPENRIPKVEVVVMVGVVRLAALTFFKDPAGMVVTALGSHRRGKPDSGDVDVLISHRTEPMTGPDCRCRIACSCTGLHGHGSMRCTCGAKARNKQLPCTCGAGKHNILPKLISLLRQKGFLIEDLEMETAGGWDTKVPTRTRSCNGNKYLGVCRPPPPYGSKVRRIDLFTCPADQIAAATLTYTGSDVHNRSMRNWASAVGYVLSEKALCPCVRSNRAKYQSDGGGASFGKWQDNKEWVGDAVDVETEQDIFTALGLRYLPPAQRTGQVEHLPLHECSELFVARIFAAHICKSSTLAEAFAAQRVDGARLVAMDDAELRAILQGGDGIQKKVAESNPLMDLFNMDAAAPQRQQQRQPEAERLQGGQGATPDEQAELRRRCLQQRDLIHREGKAGLWRLVRACG